jgi:hypothetical protein
LLACWRELKPAFFDGLLPDCFPHSARLALGWRRLLQARRSSLIFSIAFETFVSRRLKQAAVDFVHGRD